VAVLNILSAAMLLFIPKPRARVAAA
jgi:hypothetical protein